MPRKAKISPADSPWEANFITAVTLTAGAEAANVIRVSVQTKDPWGGNPNGVPAGALPWWISTSAIGNQFASAPSGGVAIGTAGTLIEAVDNRHGLLITDATGATNVDITDSGTSTLYFCVLLPSGKVQTVALPFA